MNAGNVYAGIHQQLPDELPDELLEQLYASAGLRIERIVSRGQPSPAEGHWYDQSGDEWVVLLSGHAKILFDDPRREVSLVAGDWLLIPAHARHRVTHTRCDPPCIWLAVHLPSET